MGGIAEGAATRHKRYDAKDGTEARLPSVSAHRAEFEHEVIRALTECVEHARNLASALARDLPASQAPPSSPAPLLTLYPFG